MTSEREIIARLNELIQACKDAECGFRKAVEAIKSPQLKVQLSRHAEQRARFALQLQSEVRRLGGIPPQSGSMAASMHRGWMNLKLALMGQEDAVVLGECERGESMTVELYEEALARPLPDDVRAVLEHQHRQIKQVHDEIRTLELASRNPEARSDTQK